ncbi:hypothetical protein UC34_20590 [Pandoraea vervacti]|uniref:Uncharacterized protein n=1 Tax=Pandoraea vervacti TaxID=656178 RepID=A0ABN4FSI1_9BURK|nr:hypothetical protein UC34_20590 [Pandoraea vervacti]
MVRGLGRVHDRRGMAPDRVHDRRGMAPDRVLGPRAMVRVRVLVRRDRGAVRGRVRRVAEVEAAMEATMGVDLGEAMATVADRRGAVRGKTDSGRGPGVGLGCLRAGVAGALTERLSGGAQSGYR